MSIKGLEQAIANLNSISKKAVPRASAQTVNRIATQAVNRSVSTVAKSTRVPRKLVRQRARVRRATVAKPRALIRINRGNLPAICPGVNVISQARTVSCVWGAFVFPGPLFGNWQTVAGMSCGVPRRAGTPLKWSVFP